MQEVVIKIPEEEYNKIINTHPNMCSFIEQQIKMGTVLPKGHGRFIDADALMEDVKKHYFDDHKAIRYVEIPLSVAPTVLEADRGDVE